MKNLLFTIATGVALLAFAGCYGNDTSTDDGTAKAAPQKAQCGTGKCGGGK